MTRLFSSLEDADEIDLTAHVLGFDSVDTLVVVSIVIVYVFIAFFVVFTIYQALANQYQDAQLLRLLSSGRPPELALHKGLAYHLFLYHIWSSGQDQVANIKRKLQLMLPDCHIFLDVDDLEDTGDLEHYIGASQCILIFLSSGYFFSANCLREFDSSLNQQKPL
eukprot:348325-Prymnesium_polylepis.1